MMKAVVAVNASLAAVVVSVVAALYGFAFKAIFPLGD